MAKDPAFLFYSNDFISGTFAMSDEQVGKYIRMLCMQHQKVRLTEKEIRYLSNNDEDILSKFKTEIIEDKVYYFNTRLREEAEKRKNYTQSRRNNLGKNDDKNTDMKLHMSSHMENENENENEKLRIKDEKSKIKKFKTNPDFILFKETIQFEWNVFAKLNDLPSLMSFTTERENYLIERYSEPEFKIQDILNSCKKSKWLMSKVPKLNLDFIIKTNNNYIKILEGNYETLKSDINTGNNKRIKAGQSQQTITGGNTIIC